MLAEKKRLSLVDMEAQTALELPDREMLGLVTIVVANVVTGVSIPINVSNNKVAVEVCAAVDVIEVLTATNLTCTIQQH